MLGCVRRLSEELAKRHCQFSIYPTTGQAGSEL